MNTKIQKQTHFPRTTASQRQLLFQLWEATGEVQLACRKARVSERTFYNWKPKFLCGGYEALEQFASHAPKNPHRVKPEVEQKVIQLRQQHPNWGKQRIADELSKSNNWLPLVSPNTVRRILLEAGLWTQVKTQAKKKEQTRATTADKPGQTLNVDLCFVPVTHEVAEVAVKLPAVSGSSGRLVVERTLDKAAKSEPQWPGRIFEDQNLTYEEAMASFASGEAKSKPKNFESPEAAAAAALVAEKRAIRQEEEALRAERRLVRTERKMEDQAWVAIRERRAAQKAAEKAAKKAVGAQKAAEKAAITPTEIVDLPQDTNSSSNYETQSVSVNNALLNTSPSTRSTISRETLEISHLVEKVTTGVSQLRHLAAETTTSELKTSHLAAETTTSELKTSHLTPETTTSELKTSHLAAETTTSEIKTSHLAAETTTSELKTSHLTSETTTSELKTSHLVSETTTSEIKTGHFIPERSSSKVEASPLASEATTSEVETSPLGTFATAVGTSPLTSEAATSEVQTSPLTPETTASKVEISPVASEATTSEVETSPLGTFVTAVETSPLTSEATTSEVKTSPLASETIASKVEISPVASEATTSEVETSPLSVDTVDTQAEGAKKKPISDSEWRQLRALRRAQKEQRQEENLKWREKRLSIRERLGALPFVTAWIAILVIVDNCTRQCISLPLFMVGPHVTAEMIVEALRTLLPPELQFLISDRGTHFRAKVFEMFAQSVGFQHVFTARHRPQSNGIAERFVRTLKEWLADKSWNSEEELLLLLAEFQEEYNERPHQGIGIPGLSPNEYARRIWLM